MSDGLSQSDTEFAECQQYYGYPCGKLIALLGRALAAEATVARLRCGLDEIDAQLHGGGRSAARMIIESLRPLATPTEDEGSVAT